MGLLDIIISEIKIPKTIEIVLEEILGLLVIIFLLLIIKRIRSSRKYKKEKISQFDQPQDPLQDSNQSQTAGQLDVESETFKAEQIIQEEIFEEDLQVETIPDISPEISEPEISDTLKDIPAPIPEDDLADVEPGLVESPTGFIDRLKSGLSKTRQSLSKRFDSILSMSRSIDEDMLEQIEEVLITSDIGVPTTMELMDKISKRIGSTATSESFKTDLKAEMMKLIDFDVPDITLTKPHIIMVVGVNGVGKTTSIGKLAAKLTSEGKKVLLSASDTFRAAAVEQLEIWAKRADADIVKHRDKSDPAAVAYDSIEAAIARDVDVVIVDTAGRLHTKVNLMEELKKIKRSIGKKIADAPHDTFLVLDATTGQNAVSQAKLFNEDIGISGIVLTKLDGTAKGGIVLSICNTLKVPIRYIGIGEAIDDLQEFDPKLFVDALL